MDTFADHFLSWRRRCQHREQQKTSRAPIVMFTELEQSGLSMNVAKHVSGLSLVLAGLMVNAPAHCESVIPAGLAGTNSVALGRMIQSLMPNSTDGSIGWNRQANAEIRWDATGYKTELTTYHGTIYSRTGIVRINNQGNVARVLSPTRAELGWTITYSSKADPSNGVERISISAGTQEEICFGSRYEGCNTVAPIQSLLSAGVKAKMLCRERDGPDEVIAYMLHSTGKRPTLMAWWTSGGTGGSGSQIDLELTRLADRKYCKDWLD